jgi:hypothetical protein
MIRKHIFHQSAALSAIFFSVFFVFSGCFFETEVGQKPPIGPETPAAPGINPETLPDNVYPFSDGTVTIPAASTARTVYLVQMNTNQSSVGHSPSLASPSEAGPSASSSSEPYEVSAEYESDGEIIKRLEPAFVRDTLRFNLGPDKLKQEIPAPSRQLIGESGYIDNNQFSTKTVGSPHDFWIVENTGASIYNFITKAATLRAIGEHCKIWVADESWEAGGGKPHLVTQTQADAAADKFDYIYEIETNILGYEYGGGPDGLGGADHDDKIQILVFDIDNNDTAVLNGSYVLGYFYSVDEYTNDEPSYKSNEAEIFYMDSLFIKDDYKNYFYSTLIHEFNHMINYNQKVIKPNRAPDFPGGVAAWYTEMLSMLAEDLIGPMVGIPVTDSTHPAKSRINYWLPIFSNQSPLYWSNDLNSYAANYAFGAYLMRNFGGPALLSAIAQSPDDDGSGIDEQIKALDSEKSLDYAIYRFGEAIALPDEYQSNENVSFNNTVSETIGGVDYVFTGFDPWLIPNAALTELPENERYGFEIIPYDGTIYNCPDVCARLYSKSEWTNTQNQVNITLPNNYPNYEFYVVVLSSE